MDSTIPNLLAAEVWALRTATGARAYLQRLRTFGTRLAIIVDRFDREPDGIRLQQEDFTQALALPSTSKYEGPAV